MIWINRILTFLIGFGAVWGVVFLIITTYGWERVWASIHGNADLGTVEFGQLAGPPGPNQVLTCPETGCGTAYSSNQSPVYAVDVETLQLAFVKALEQETGLERVDDGADPMKLRYIQRSRLLRIPETVVVQFFDVGDGSRSTLALSEVSQVDLFDFGLTVKRPVRWLGRLQNLEE
jgi:hypothetical protein